MTEREMTGADDSGRLSAAGYGRLRNLLGGMAPWLLLCPTLCITLAFFALPAFYTLRMSFNLADQQRLYVTGFTFANYVGLSTDPVFIQTAVVTVRLAIMASVCTLLIGYPLALIAWLKPARWRIAIIGLALSPFLISEISIIIGWWMFFPRNGLLSLALVSSGLVTDKVSLLYTEFAAFVGLVYITLPFCFFIMLSVFDGIDKRLLEASGDLNASPVSTFLEIILPLTRRAIAVAFAQAFIWSMGTYATPYALGPDTLWTIGYLIQDQMLTKHNWPKAAALAVILALGVTALMVLMRAASSARSRFHV